MILDCSKYVGPCRCGREHTLETKKVVVEYNALDKFDQYMDEVGLTGKRAVIYDTNTYNLPTLKHVRADQEIVLNAEGLHSEKGMIEDMMRQLDHPDVIVAVGSGTILDTSRLQSTLAKRFCISPKNVHAHVYGEHGDSSFAPWSLVHIANNHIDSYKAHSPDHDRIKWNQDYEEIEQFVKTSGAQVIKNKGATFYAVAMSVCHLCKCVQSTAGTALTVSTMMHGEYGVSDVCLSTLALVDNQGVRGKILNQLTDGEIDKLRASAEKLKDVIRQVEI